MHIRKRGSAYYAIGPRHRETYLGSRVDCATVPGAIAFWDGRAAEYSQWAQRQRVFGRTARAERLEKKAAAAAARADRIEALARPVACPAMDYREVLAALAREEPLTIPTVSAEEGRRLIEALSAQDDGRLLREALAGGLL